MDQEQLLAQIKARLAEVYGNRLKGAILYGSEARGEATEDSDIDIMVLLHGEVELGKDLRRCIDAVYPLSLDVGRPISPAVVNANEYEAQEWPLYRKVRREGLPA